MAKIDPDEIPDHVSDPNPDEGFGAKLSDLAVLSCECALEAYMALPKRARDAANMAHHETVAVTIFRDRPEVAVVTMFGNDGDGNVLYHLQWDMGMSEVESDRWEDAEKV